MNQVEALAPRADDMAQDPGVDQLQGRRLTVNDPRLKAMQRVHALTISGLGLSGLALGVYLALHGHPPSRTALALFFSFFLLAGCGITVGYHRCFTHRAFRASPAVRAALAILGSMSGQGPVVYWTAVHRMHHMTPDKKGDPHSPNLHGDGLRNKLRGAFHAVIGWTVAHEVPNTNVFSRDLMSDRTVMWVNRRYYWCLLAGWLLPAALGALFAGGAYGALEGLLWGGLIRMFAANGGLYAIAFFGHATAFGQRPFHTPDQSKNNFWMALPSLGEAWHNNHHAFPRAAIFGLRWWQFDLGGLVVVALERLGLISEVCRATPAEIAQRGVGP